MSVCSPSPSESDFWSAGFGGIPQKGKTRTPNTMAKRILKRGLKDRMRDIINRRIMEEVDGKTLVAGGRKGILWNVVFLT